LVFGLVFSSELDSWSFFLPLVLFTPDIRIRYHFVSK
jgi:hypothetical protein